MSETLTPEVYIAAGALFLSTIAFLRGEQTKKREEETRQRQEQISQRQEQISQFLANIEWTRFQHEQAAAQATANFSVWAEKTPMPYSVEPSQQPHDPLQPPPPQYQYTFHVQNVGKSVARELSIEVRTIDGGRLHRSGTADPLRPTYTCQLLVVLGDFPQLKLALGWKDNVNPEGDFVETSPLVFAPPPRPKTGLSAIVIPASELKSRDQR